MIIPDQNREEQTTPNFPTQAQINAFNDLYQECQKLQAENIQWRERFAELEERIEYLEEETRRKEIRIHRLEMDRLEEEDLRANDHLSHTHKAVLRTIQEIVRTLRVDDTTPTTIHLGEISKKTATGERQVRRVIEDLDQWGLITKDTKQWKEGKVWKSEMTIAMGGKAKNPAKSIETVRKKAGGYRRCHNCGSKNIEAIAYQCIDCGHYGPIEDK